MGLKFKIWDGDIKIRDKYVIRRDILYLNTVEVEKSVAYDTKFTFAEIAGLRMISHDPPGGVQTQRLLISLDPNTKLSLLKIAFNLIHLSITNENQETQSKISECLIVIL